MCEERRSRQKVNQAPRNIHYRLQLLSKISRELETLGERRPPKTPSANMLVFDLSLRTSYYWCAGEESASTLIRPRRIRSSHRLAVPQACGTSLRRSHPHASKAVCSLPLPTHFVRCARERSRTSTSLRTPAPQAGVYTISPPARTIYIDAPTIRKAF